jgi:hypothetical protein
MLTFYEGIRLGTFLRSSRRQYYLASIVYGTIIAVVLAVTHLVASVIFNLILKVDNFQSVGSLIGRFIFLVLAYLMVLAICSCYAVLILTNAKLSWIFPLGCFAIGMVLDRFDNLKVPFQNINTGMVSLCIMAIGIMFAGITWLQIRKMDIK